MKKTFAAVYHINLGFNRKNNYLLFPKKDKVEK